MDYVRGYRGFITLPCNNDFQALVINSVSVGFVDVPVDLLANPIQKNNSFYSDEGCSVKETNKNELITISKQLEFHQYKLWNSHTHFEKYKSHNTLMKVLNAPMILFSDDISGSRSKQYNKFDSFFMVPPMTFEKRNIREKQFFLCTSCSVSATDMLPPIVDDCLLLENGIEMYSAVYKEYVQVVDPILLISGDYPRHSQLATCKGASSSFYCRKCLIPTPENPSRGVPKYNYVPLNSLLVLDNHCIQHAINNCPNISYKPKVRLLAHLHEDIVRFGCILHYETERGEQFNKFIREHISQTNRQNISCDMAARFR